MIPIKDIMVIIIGSGPKFKSWTAYVSHSTNTLWKDMNLTILPSAMGK